MPKQKAGPDFDALGLLHAVAEQDIGLRVSTNNPAGFRRVLYKAMRAAVHLRCHVYADPRSKSCFCLTKTAVPLAAPLPDDLPEESTNV